MVCYRSDFKDLSSMLYEIATTNEAKQHFNEMLDLSPKLKNKSKWPIQSIVIKLFSFNRNKFKLSLDIIKNNSIIDDYNSRIFTINAMYCELNSKRLLKFDEYLSDFENKIIRTVKLSSEMFGRKISLFLDLLNS